MKNNKIIFVILIGAVILGIGFFGIVYVNGHKSNSGYDAAVKETGSYWTCPMHPSVRADGPGKCPICGMDLIKVEKKEENKASSQEPVDNKDYYGCGVEEFGHCPKCDEGKPDADCICGGHKFVAKGDETHCPICGKELKKLSRQEVTGMSEEDVADLSLTKRQSELSGIITSMVMKENVFKEVRTVGKIAYDPELNIAQEEFLIALEASNNVKNSPDSGVVERANSLVEKSKIRLKILGLSDEQIKQIEDSKTTTGNLILPEDKVWVYADIYEYELSWVKEGLTVKVTTQSYPGEEFNGTIRAIGQILDPNTRSAKARLEIDNPDKKLKLEMFVDVFIQSSLGDVLAVRREALLDTGMRKIVWVDKGNGNFAARDVKTGPEGFALIENEKVRVFPVLSGLNEGEYVVTKGNFLLDSQSQLTGGMSLQWGGASEIKDQTGSGGETKPIATQHRH